MYVILLYAVCRPFVAFRHKVHTGGDVVGNTLKDFRAPDEARYAGTVKQDEPVARLVEGLRL